MRSHAGMAKQRQGDVFPVFSVGVQALLLSHLTWGGMRAMLQLLCNTLHSSYNWEKITKISSNSNFNFIAGTRNLLQSDHGLDVTKRKTRVSVPVTPLQFVQFLYLHKTRPPSNKGAQVVNHISAFLLCLTESVCALKQKYVSCRVAGTVFVTPCYTHTL